MRDGEGNKDAREEAQQEPGHRTKPGHLLFWEEVVKCDRKSLQHIEQVPDI